MQFVVFHANYEMTPNLTAYYLLKMKHNFILFQETAKGERYQDCTTVARYHCKSLNPLEPASFVCWGHWCTSHLVKDTKWSPGTDPSFLAFPLASPVEHSVLLGNVWLKGSLCNLREIFNWSRDQNLRPLLFCVKPVLIAKQNLF